MKSTQTADRRGAIAPLTALLAIPLLGMMAFSVDMGWITHTQNELQSAADAAALAGASQLTNSFVNYYLPGQTTAQQSTILGTAQTNAVTYAQNYASYNRAADVKSLTLLSSDVEFGFTDSTGAYTPLPTYTGFPNTVKVVLRRDASANGALGLFFAPVLGTSSINLKATAAATLYAGTINSFNTSSSFNVRILPMTYDVNHWNNFLATGQDPDGNTSTAANGYAQIGVYPSIKFTGNFGELSLDQGNDGSSTISNWINNGVSGADLANETSTGLLPLSSHNTLPPPTYTNTAPDWKGNPGLKTSTIHTAEDNVGQVYLLPLFKPVNNGVPDPSTYQVGSGNGSNNYYTIVQFVGITITNADDKSIVVQPTAVISPNALFSSLAPAAPPASSSYLSTTFSAPKLTQ